MLLSIYAYWLYGLLTCIRGTLRYAGFPEFVKVLVDMGFLSDEEQICCKEPIAWKEATQKILGASSSSEKDLTWAIMSKTTFKDNEQKEHILAGLKWLGIFSDEKVSSFVLPFPLVRGSGCKNLGASAP
jgi:saccharopine dehydrogenase (NADP+, L-glutamate forming)